MALKPAICTNCGASIKVNDIDLDGFSQCKYCRTSYKVIDVITIDGIPTAKALLTNANLSMEDGNYEKASNLFNEIIKIKPNSHEAWWGLYVCNDAFNRYYGYEDKYGNRGPEVKAKIKMDTIQQYANRAIKYAPPSIAEDYQKIVQKELIELEEEKASTIVNSSSIFTKLIDKFINK